MKTLRMLVLLAAGMVLCSGLFADDGVKDNQGQGGKDHGYFQELVKSLPGAEAEIARHKSALEALHKERREAAKTIREQAKDQKQPVDRDKIRAAVTAIVEKIVEERATHRENMAKLIRANKADLAAKIVAHRQETRQAKKGKAE